MRFGLPNIAVKVVEAHGASFRSICPPEPTAPLCRLKANALRCLMPFPLTTWRTPMLTRLKAGLDRLGAAPEADVIGAVAVFALPILMLALGRLIDGGM